MGRFYHLQDNSLDDESGRSEMEIEWVIEMSTISLRDSNLHQNEASSEQYGETISRLGIPPVIDIWATKRSSEVGLTTSSTRIFSFIPVPRQIDVIKWTAGVNRYLIIYRSH